MENIEKKCPVCGTYAKLVEVLSGKINTANVVSDYQNNIHKVDLSIYQCENCGHGFIDNHLADEFYEDFVIAAVGLRTAKQPVEDSRVAEFERMIQKVKHASKTSESLFEIGSGGGFLLEVAQKHYKKTIGIEPSKKEAELSWARGINVINDYFTPQLNFKERFSSIISTMVFEHIPDVKEAMEYTYELLDDEGAALIQIPNGQRTLSKKVYFDIYPQHLHYFTPLSLAKLAVQAGFEVLSVETAQNRNYIEMLVKKNSKGESFGVSEERDRQTFGSFLTNYESVALWGASYAARSCVKYLDDPKIKYFFDMSETKVDRYISGYSRMIGSPDKEKVNSVQAVIILANEYTDDIVEILKNKFSYTGDILYFDDNCQLKSDRNIG